MRDGTSPSIPVLLPVELAADRLSIGRTTIYKLMDSRELPYVRVGRTRRIAVDALAEFIARHSVGGINA